jgi:septum formation topological specificity factor MinE
MYVYVYICVYVYIDADGLEHLVAAARAEWWDTEKLVELRTDVYKAVKRYKRK